MDDIRETLTSPTKNPAYRKALLETISDSFKLFIDECADPFFVHDNEGNILEVNRSACESLGYTREELLDLTVQQIETGFDTKQLNELWPALVPGQSRTLLGVHKRKDGTTFPIEVRLAKMPANKAMLVVAVARDRSERQIKELELRTLNEDLTRSLAAERKLTERLTTRFVLTSVLAESKSIKEASPKFLKLIAQQDEWDFVYFCAIDHNGQYIHESETKGPSNSTYKRLEELLKPLVHTGSDSTLSRTWSSEKAQWIEDVASSRTSDALHVKERDMKTLVVIPIVGNEKAIGVMCLVSEAARPENLETLNFYSSLGSQIGQFTDRIKATSIAREITLMRQRDDFMAMLTHDLKTPLLGANRILDLLTSDAVGALSDQQREILKQLQVSNSELVTMVQNLIGVYRYERQLAQVKFASADLCAIVRAAVREETPIAQAKQIPIEVMLPEAPLNVDLDPDSVNRAIKNLLDNAIKFTPKQGKVSVLVKIVSASECLLEVSDTGVGLSEAECASLFTRFWQGTVGKQYSAGVGLGLYLCKQIVDAHNGDIKCESKVDEGSVFTIKLPIKQTRVI